MAQIVTAAHRDL